MEFVKEGENEKLLMNYFVSTVLVKIIPTRHVASKWFSINIPKHF